MNKTIRFIQNYLIMGLPLVIACMLWETFSPSIENGNGYSQTAKWIWTGLSFNIMLWFTLLILFLVVLVFVQPVREKTLRRLANMKDRDEREQYITGKASRAAYISTLSLVIFFLFFSLFTFNITKLPPDQNAGHSLRAGIGIHFSLLNSDSKPQVINKQKQ